MIPRDDLQEAVRALEEKLVDLDYGWVIQFVDAQEEEAEALRVFFTYEGASPWRGRFGNGIPDKTPIELDPIDMVRPENRRVLLLILALHLFCVMPVHWIKEACRTLVDYPESDIRDVRILGLLASELADNQLRELERSVKELAGFLVQHSDDERTTQILQSWVLGEAGDSDAS